MLLIILVGILLAALSQVHSPISVQWAPAKLGYQHNRLQAERHKLDFRSTIGA